MKRKVLFIIDSLGCGGAEKSMVSLLPLLDYSRLEVNLCIVSRGGVFENYLPPEVNLVNLPAPSFFSEYISNALFSMARRCLSLLSIKRHNAELAWICKRLFFPDYKEKYDIAVAYHQGFPTYYVADKVHADKKIAWVNADMEKAGYHPHFNRPYYEKMSKVCVVSNMLYNMLPSAGYVDNHRLMIVKDIVNVNLIQQLSKESIRVTNPTDVIKLLTVGRMVSSKNYPLAVETARILSRAKKSFVWYFVGDGSSRGTIERLVNKYGLMDKVFIAGTQINPYPYFRMCDIYVHTSSFEGFGLTISEAKALHKPVVTTNFPSAYDQIVDGENGLIAEMSAESLAEKILSLIESPSLRNHLIHATESEINSTMETESKKVNRLLLEI